VQKNREISKNNFCVKASEEHEKLFFFLKIDIAARLFLARSSLTQCFRRFHHSQSHQFACLILQRRYPCVQYITGVVSVSVKVCQNSWTCFGFLNSRCACNVRATCLLYFCTLNHHSAVQPSRVFCAILNRCTSLPWLCWIQFYAHVIGEKEISAFRCLLIIHSVSSFLFVLVNCSTVPRCRWLRGLGLTPRCTCVPSCTMGQFTIEQRTRSDPRCTEVDVGAPRCEPRTLEVAIPSVFEFLGENFKILKS